MDAQQFGSYIEKIQSYGTIFLESIENLMDEYILNYNSY